MFYGRYNILINGKLRNYYCLGLGLVILAGVLAGCSKQQPVRAAQAVEVKAMQVIQRDTPLTYVYTGQVQAKEEIQLRARVSGNIVAKMVNGGDTVRKGQPLFQIDRRQYQSTLLSAQAQLAQSEAALSNAHADTLRYKKLAQMDAIAKQILDTQISTERQNVAIVEANRAKLQQAQNDLEDTTVVSPIDGKIDVKDLSIGSYVQAGSTTLATISSVNPVFIQFSMSENEYLQLAQSSNGQLPNEWGNDLKLFLSNGSQYPLSGTVEQVDRGLTEKTGALTVKAVFANPHNILIPGMFARVEVKGEVRKGALLVPQRAVQQMLGKTFVTLAGSGDKAEMKEVKMGPKVGSLWLVEQGIKAADRIIVEGAAKVQTGTQLKVVMIGLNDLDSSLK